MRIKRPLSIFILRIVLGVFIIAWAVAIFCFSSVPADRSDEASISVGEQVARVVVNDYDNLDTQQRQSLLSKFNHLIRKSAHFGEFCLLGVLVYGFALTFWVEYNKINITNLKRKIRPLSPLSCALYSLGACAIYACSDELHQVFVPERGPGIIDVLIDSAGSAIGILILLAYMYLIVKISMIKKRRDFPGSKMPSE